MSKHAYPIGLAKLSADEKEGMLPVEWYSEYGWKKDRKKSVLSHSNSMYAVFWDMKKRERVYQTLSKDEVLPITVKIAYEKGEQMRVSPETVEAAVAWCQKNIESCAVRKRQKL